MFNLSAEFQRFKNKRKGNMWQLFRATDFESLMYPCCIFCHIIGIFPYKIKAMTIKASKPNHIISTIFIWVFCFSLIINFYEMNISENSLYITAETSRMLERNSFFFFGGFVAIITFILNESRTRLLQTILEISSNLPLESYQNLSKLIHVKDIFGFLFLNIQMLTFYFIAPFEVLRKILILYIYLLVFQTDMFYMNCVCILKACFKQINDNLANLREFVTNDEPYLLSGIQHKQRNPLLEMKITALKKQHMTISDTVQSLNMIFSLQLLATIVMTFIQVTFNLYFYVEKIQSQYMSMNDLQKYMYYEFAFATVTFYCTKIVLIVWACETGKNEAMKINSIIYDISNSTDNKQIKYELQLFALQLLHRKNEFSAKVFTMDAMLLTAIIGSITMYLLILIQFHLMTNSCNPKSGKSSFHIESN